MVTDTVSGGGEGEETPITQSTISRFACRVVCERNPPYTARIYAAGFDSSKNIFLGVSVFSCLVLKWNYLWDTFLIGDTRSLIKLLFINACVCAVWVSIHFC